MADNWASPVTLVRDAMPASELARKTVALDTDIESCRAFGYLRGVQERALAVRFEFLSGNQVWLPYSWLGPWEFNPSAGLLMKFTGDTVVLVAVHGSNLSAQVGGSGVNLTDRGLQRHRIVWVKEMNEDEIRRAPEGEPTIDRFEIASFDAPDKLKEWVRKHAPGFVGGPIAGG